MGQGRHNLWCFFADYAREQGLLHGGVFWVTADGNKQKVLSSFVEFAESLEQYGLPEARKKQILGRGGVVASEGIGKS